MKIVCLVFCLFLCACSNTPSTTKITVATAASTQYVLDALIKEFEQESTIQVQKLVSSSGKLTAQIENGAPVDIFMSADLKYPSYLYQKGLCVDSPVVYAYGQLVLWTMLDNIDLTAPPLTILNNPKLQKIAVADPQTAPYGLLSVAYLKDINSYNSIQKKLVYGESIAQVNQYVMTQSVELGLTALSVVKAPLLQGRGQFVVLPEAKLPQGMILLNTNANSKVFYDFLQSDKAKIIFRQYGL